MAIEKYVLITPARNEDEFIENTIKSICSQTRLPEKWIIVSDGSTDRTDEIVRNYERQNRFIYLLRRDGENNRNFGSQLRAIQAGYEVLKGIEYEFIGNLDADITFENDYFENLILKFKENKSLGIAGGFVYERLNGIFYPRKFNRKFSVPHAVQLFRRECYENVGGYIALPFGGGDTYIETLARMKKWQVRSFNELKAYHHRFTLGSEGRLYGAWRQGLMDYSLGTCPIYEIFKCLNRVTYKPIILYSLSRLSAFFSAYIRGDQFAVSREFVDYLRSEQKRHIKSALLLKSFEP